MRTKWAAPAAIMLGWSGHAVHGGGATVLPAAAPLPGAAVMAARIAGNQPDASLPYAPLALNGGGAETPVALALYGGMTTVMPPPSPASASPSPLTEPKARIADPAERRAQSPDPAAPGQPVESLRDAIVEALRSNPEIQIALAEQDDARWGVHEARAGYLPHLDLTVGYGREVTRQPSQPTTWRWRTEGTITLNQNVWDFGTTTNDIKRARATYRSAQWGTRERIEAIAFDITNAYLGILQQQKLIALTEQEIAATQKILRMVTVQEDLGLTTQADVDRAKSRLKNIQSTLLDRESGLQQARDAYRRLTDHAPGRAVDLPPAGAALPPGTEEAIALIDDHSPRMAQAVEDRRSLARQYDSQTGTFFPRIGVQLQGNHKYDVLGQNGLTQDARAVVTMSYNFFNGGADIALRNRIAARLRQADYEVERRRREVEQDIRADFEALRAAREKIATIDAEIASAERVADLYKQQFREGKRSVFDMLDSQQVLFAARGNAVTNEIAMQLAEYRVLQKLGGLFDLMSGSEPLPPLVMPAPGPKAD